MRKEDGKVINVSDKKVRIYEKQYTAPLDVPLREIRFLDAPDDDDKSTAAQVETRQKHINDEDLFTDEPPSTVHNLDN